MKKNFIIALFLISFALVDFTSAGSLKNLDEQSYEKYETNLLEGLNSENFGLQFSCAYLLGELRSEKAVLPLVKLLRESTSEDLRIISALSLIKIDSELGIFMVKQGQKFNDNEKTREKCTRFYTAYIMEKYDIGLQNVNLFAIEVVK